MRRFIPFTFLLLAFVGCQNDSAMFMRGAPKGKPTDKKGPTQEQPEITLRRATKDNPCPTIRAAEQNLLPNADKLSQDGRNDLVDMILISLGGARCESAVQALNEFFKNDPITTWRIQWRVQQITRLSPKDIIDIANTTNGQSVAIDAPEVWKKADDRIQSKKIDKETVEVTGTVEDWHVGYSADQKGMVVRAKIPAKALKSPDHPTKEEVAKAVEGAPVIIEHPKDKKPELVTDPGRNIEKAGLELIKNLEDNMKQQQDKVKEREASPKKLAFDLTDAAEIDACGDKDIRDRMRRNLSAINDEFHISGIQADGAEKATAAAVENATKFASKEKKPDQGFWDFSDLSDGLVTVYLVKVSVQKADNDSATERISLFEYDLGKDDYKKTEDKEISYLVNKLPDFSKRPTIYLDVDSALWLTDRIEVVESCLEKRNIAAQGASRESLLAYTLYQLVDKKK